MLVNKEISTYSQNNQSISSKFYYIETYGCQMNVADSELIESQLINEGYKKTKQLDLANIIFLNTCAIREKAQETVHNRLNSLAYLKKKNAESYTEVVKKLNLRG